MRSTTTHQDTTQLHIHPKTYIKELISSLESLCVESLSSCVDLIFSALVKGNTIYVAGNGGSSASASHMSADINNALYTIPELKGRFVNLSESNARITAIANDFGYEQVYSRQLNEAVEGDILLLFSVSGNSENLKRALSSGKNAGMTIISLTAQSSFLSFNSDISIIAGNSDYGISEDIQCAFSHIVKRKVQGSSAKVN